MSRLFTLQRIVQKVSQSPDLDSALTEIVNGVKIALNVDASSVYLKPADSQVLTLMASVGLHNNSINKITVPTEQGLVGLVAETAEPVNLCDAASHQRYVLNPDAGEDKYQSFLGVPIIDHRRLYGVLVIQRAENSPFDDDDVAFLVTLGAQMAGAISHAELIGGITNKDNRHSSIPINGIAGSPGIAIGTASVIFHETDLQSIPGKKIEDVANECKRFQAAVGHVIDDLAAIRDQLGEQVPAETRMIFDAYIMMCSSGLLQDNVLDLIKAGEWAPGALKQTIREFSNSFAEMEDEYLSERVVDVQDLGRRILRHLMTDQPGCQEYAENTILVGRDITATQLAEIPKDKLAAVVSTSGTSSSHIAILARALGVPTVMGAENLPVSQLQDCTIIVDGYAGRLSLRPSPELLQEYRVLYEEDKELGEELQQIASQPAVTKNGQKISVYVNSGLIGDLPSDRSDLCDGLGLHRTELPFMLRDGFPSEDEQVALYSKVLSLFPDKPVTLRTLDIGGDKPLSYFPIEESNPFLGWRGVRIMLDHPDIFLTQLRAMLRANIETSNLHILFPMISSVTELEETLDLLAQARAELGKKGYAIPAVKTGVMIEVPSAVYMASQLAERVDFLSIGTNDLIQYLLAVDRNNSKVASLYSETHPAVLMAIDSIVKQSHQVGKPVSVCGEMASEPGAALLLLGAGVDSLSVSRASLPSIKWLIQSFSILQAQELFATAIELGEPVAVHEMLNAALVDAGLGGLVRAGKT